MRSQTLGFNTVNVSASTGLVMNLKELEGSYREEIEQMGNRLQNAVLALAQAEAIIVQMGDVVQNLNGIVEEFIQQQQQES